MRQDFASSARSHWSVSSCRAWWVLFGFLTPTHNLRPPRCQRLTATETASTRPSVAAMKSAYRVK